MGICRKFCDRFFNARRYDDEAMQSLLPVQAFESVWALEALV
jgi:hypothetical protein